MSINNTEYPQTSLNKYNTINGHVLLQTDSIYDQFFLSGIVLIRI